MLSMAVIVYCDAPELKTRLPRLTIISVLMTSVTFDVPNVATSDVPFGTVLGIQLAALFQSLLEGLLLHVALPATDCRCATRDSSAAALRTVNLFMQMFRL